MDKFLAILSVVIFGILFIGAVNVVFIKKSFDVSKEVSNVSLVGAFILLGLPVLLGLSALF